MKRYTLFVFVLLALSASAQYRGMMATNASGRPMPAVSWFGTPAVATTVDVDVNYGYLYNWYAVTDEHNIANKDWHVPEYSEITTLYTTAGSGGALKETGYTYWQSTNSGASNTSKFNGRGAGARIMFDGTFLYLTQRMYIQSVTIQDGTMNKMYYLKYNGSTLTAEYNKYWVGVSVRLVKDVTSLTDGQTGTYIGNDGKIYQTICIGTQEWTAENLCETKYRDGTPIPEVTGNAAWAALTTGARCSYANDEANAINP